MKKLAYLMLAIDILLVAGIFWFQSTCEVINNSSFTLRDVEVSITSPRYGSPAVRKVSELKSGEKAHFRFFPPAEAEVDIAFTANNRQSKEGVLSYYEGGAIKITIGPDLKVKGTVDLLSH